MIKNSRELKYSYADVCIVPAEISKIEHRADCNPYVEDRKLPLFTSPMSSVVGGKETMQSWISNGITPIMPRSIGFDERKEWAESGGWIAVSLSEVMQIQSGWKVLIDIANGHMGKLYSGSIPEYLGLVGAPGETKVMIGNIANPETYRRIVGSGVYSYVRVGIGTGRGCITSSNTGIHYPIASLISEIYSIREELGGGDDLPRIVADGGIRGYGDVVKALALGADYVMCGYVFAKMIESTGNKWFKYNDPIYGERTKILDTETEYSRVSYKCGSFSYKSEDLSIDNIKIIKKYYGMASKQGQLDMNGQKTRTCEGLITEIPIEYTVKSWTENLTDYLRSSMSYCNSKTLNDFIGKASLVVCSPNTTGSINK